MSNALNRQVIGISDIELSDILEDSQACRRRKLLYHRKFKTIDDLLNHLQTNLKKYDKSDDEARCKSEMLCSILYKP